MRFLVTVTNQVVSYNPTAAFDSTNAVVVLNNQWRKIERVPFKKVFDIFGKEQKNAQGIYCLYLEKNDPLPELEANVSWQMNDKILTGKVKFIYIYSRIVKKIKAEIYIQSDNF